MLPLIVEFAPLFSKPVWEHAKILIVGAILTIGKRTVTASLCVTGKSEEVHFQNYHRVLNRARWSALQAAKVFLHMLVTTFAPCDELVIGIDDTIERQRGEKIKVKGIYRDQSEEFEPQALLSTNLSHTPVQMLSWFVHRWRMEVTFEEARAHLWIEIQRQWTDLAIARTTPSLFGLFSMITLMADRLIKAEVKPVRTAAWYKKQRPTFADAIAIVRRRLWRIAIFNVG